MKCMNKLALSAVVALLVTAHAEAAIVRIDKTAFTPQAGKITFSEFGVGTVNPTYNPSDYGGGAGAPVVAFGGWFKGQSAGDAATCPPGAALSGCIQGSPTGTLSLDTNSPSTFITTDGANPSSPVLSGTPQFNGPVSVLFDRDQAGVGLDGGFFDALHGTAITAFDRNGNIIGSVDNLLNGIEFLGLVTDDGTSKIAGLQFSLIGPEPAGFAIDNLMFGKAGQVVVPPTLVTPVPAAAWLFGSSLVSLGLVKRRKSKPE